MTANSNLPRVSVVIPTHNPRADYLARVIESLRHQTLPHEQWELLVVDNASREKVEGRVDIGWQPNARIVREERLGLTFARLRGFEEAKRELIVMVDDDNVLAPDYLANAVRIAQEHPMLGAFGGKCLPEFEHEPPHWLKGITSGLGLRDLGEEPVVYPCEGGKVGKCEGGGGGLRDDRQPEVGGMRPETGDGLHSNQLIKDEKTAEDGQLPTQHRQRRAVREFPDSAPIGAGMVLRRDAAAAYAERIKQQTKRLKDQETITDRKGDSLASGGDNDICLTVVEEGWQVGYLPQLQLTHLIPRQRMTLDYHKRMARDSMKSFILMLDQHGIRPWPAMTKWTLPLRVANDWWRVRPWQGPEQSLRFWGHVGMYEGRAALRA